MSIRGDIEAWATRLSRCGEIAEHNCRMLTITYDAGSDAAYVYLDEPGDFGFTETCEEAGTDSVNIDYTVTGRVLGIEILDASYLLRPELVGALTAKRKHRDLSGHEVGITTSVRGGTLRIDLGPRAGATSRTRCNSRQLSNNVEFLWADRRLASIVVWGYEPWPWPGG